MLRNVIAWCIMSKRKQHDQCRESRSWVSIVMLSLSDADDIKAALAQQFYTHGMDVHSVLSECHPEFKKKFFSSRFCFLAPFTVDHPVLLLVQSHDGHTPYIPSHNNDRWQCLWVAHHNGHLYCNCKSLCHFVHEPGSHIGMRWALLKGFDSLTRYWSGAAVDILHYDSSRYVPFIIALSVRICVCHCIV